MLTRTDIASIWLALLLAIAPGLAQPLHLLSHHAGDCAHAPGLHAASNTHEAAHESCSACAALTRNAASVTSAVSPLPAHPAAAAADATLDDVTRPGLPGLHLGRAPPSLG